MGQARLRFKSASLFLALAACVSAGSAQADPAPTGPRVISGSGTTESGRFKASAAGAVFEMPSGAKLLVSPNTTLRVFPVPTMYQLAPGAPTNCWSFSLISGRVDVDAPKSEHNAVLATMGKFNAIVSAGHVAVLVTREEAIVDNLEGEVRTLLSEHWQSVPVGSVAALSTDNPTAAPKRGLPFPVLNGGQRMFIAPNDAVVMRGFRWSATPGAARYELRVRRLVDGKVVDQHGTSQTELPDGFKPLEPGKYGLSLRSIDTRGLESSWSPEAELRVIGVLLPPGGYSHDQAIFVGAGQQVRFTNTTGLEMTYLGTGRYFPATNGASLFRNTTTVVGFRLPGTTDTATARLEPRSVYADVRISPKRAMWPRDPISIDIELRDRAGGEVPSFLRIVPQVTLGLEPVDVTFERQ
ncbi:MAG TPA: hypothetical protein VNW92_01810, partial [Polyangiaceae bacterium]|nr:hypothetical protein [Polyangiaceae bacterium]